MAGTRLLRRLGTPDRHPPEPPKTRPYILGFVQNPISKVRSLAQNPSENGRDGARSSKNRHRGLFASLEGRPPCRPFFRLIIEKYLQNRDFLRFCWFLSRFQAIFPFQVVSGWFFDL
jgi:hypothetical protein